MLGSEIVGRLFLGWLEISRFVEYIVGRQKHLALLKNDFTSAEESRLVGNRLRAFALHTTRIAHDGGQGHLFRQFLQFLYVSLNKRRPLQEILRRIAAQAKFGK